MTRGGGLSRMRLGRLTGRLHQQVDAGEIAGAVALVARHEDVHVEAVGHADLAAGVAMHADTVFRIASITEPIVAAAAMSLVEECRLRLDGPVDPWLPELADRRVLVDLAGRPDDTVPAHRPISRRDLLSLRPGLDAVMVPAGTYPVRQLIAAAGVEPSARPPASRRTNK